MLFNHLSARFITEPVFELSEWVRRGEHLMYAITGITGKVGGALARALLDQGQRVRAIVRNAKKGEEWAALGCEVSVASAEDAAALTTAFTGATAVFILPPPAFDPAPGYPEVQQVIAAVSEALTRAKPNRVLCISTIGAQSTQDNLLSQLSMVEKKLATLPMPVTFLRPGWYLENVSWDVPAARESGVIQSFLAPLDRPIPMVSTRDVGRVAAALIQDDQPRTGVVELDGPRRVSPNDLAAALSRALGKPVLAEAVPRNTWETLFRSQGMKNPFPRMRMLDGFNEGWIDFADAESARKGTVEVAEVIEALLKAPTVSAPPDAPSAPQPPYQLAAPPPYARSHSQCSP
jgi:NAD(P)H dehydrogenase (quinone)